MSTLVDLMGRFYREDKQRYSPPRARRAFRELVGRRQYGEVWLIRADQADIGYLVLTFGYSMEFYGRDAFIDDFYIAKPYRGRGIGRSVLQRVLRYARTRQLKAIHLEAHKRKRIAYRLYTAAGFGARGHTHLLTNVLA